MIPRVIHSQRSVLSFRLGLAQQRRVAVPRRERGRCQPSRRDQQPLLPNGCDARLVPVPVLRLVA